MTWNDWSGSLGGFLAGETPDSISFSISVVTNIGAIYCVVVFGYWWLRLRGSQTNLRGLFDSIVLAKVAVWFWTLTQIYQLAVIGNSLPNVSLPARLFFLVAVLRQMWVTTRVRPAPHLYEVVPSAR